jgi:hypothetical protein
MAFGRYLVEQGRTHRGVLAVGHENLPQWLFLDDNMLLLRENGQWEIHRGGQWACVIDGSHIPEFFDQNGLPPGIDTLVKYDLWSVLEKLRKSGENGVTWDPASRIAAFRNNVTERVVKLRFRSPNDSERFGTPLGEVVLIPSRDAVIRFGAFAIGQGRGIRLELPTPQQLANRLGAVEIAGTYSWRLFQPEGVEDRQTAELVWRELCHLPCVEDRPKVGTDASLPTRFKEELLRLAAYGESEIRPQLERAQADGRLRDFVQHLSQELRIARWSVVRAIAANPDDSLVDDPVMVWRGFELAVMPRFAFVIHSNIVAPLLGSNVVPLDLKASLADAAGNLGPPGWLADYVPALGADQRFLEAVLHSRWQWECTRDHEDACLAKLVEAEHGGELERVAIETLLRLNALPRIPQDRYEAWYQSQVVQARDPVRRENLRLLSLQPAGQAFLVERLETRRDPPGTFLAAARVMKTRAEAVQRTQRFDFMTAERCQRVLESVAQVPAFSGKADLAPTASVGEKN